MLNKLVSVVLFIHCVLLLVLGNIAKTVSLPGLYNKKVMCLTFVSLIYMMVVVCNKALTSVAGVPAVLLFGVCFICAGAKLLSPGDAAPSILDEKSAGKVNAVTILGSIAGVVSVLLGLVLTLSSCKK